MNDVQALEQELIGLVEERKIAVRRGDTNKVGFIDDVIANRRWWLQRFESRTKRKRLRYTGSEIQDIRDKARRSL